MKSFMLKRTTLALLIPLLLLGSLASLMLLKSTINSTLSLAITIDLLLVVPLVYFLLIRKTSIPKTTVVPIMVIGLVLGSFLLPAGEQFYLEAFKTYALPLVELAVLTFIIIKVRKAVLAYRKVKDASPDFYTTLKNTCREILPAKAVAPFANEVAIIYYGFFSWRKPKLQANQYTYHKRSGAVALLGAFMLIIGIETFALHFLVMQWSNVLAWILTLISVYTLLQVLGMAKSLSRRPIAIEADHLVLRYGLFAETHIPFDAIEEVEASRKALPKEDKLNRKLSPLGELESHNLILHLNTPQIIHGLYGSKKEYVKLALHVDDRDKFREAIAQNLEADQG